MPSIATSVTSFEAYTVTSFTANTVNIHIIQGVINSDSCYFIHSLYRRYLIQDIIGSDQCDVIYSIYSEYLLQNVIDSDQCDVLHSLYSEYTRIIQGVIHSDHLWRHSQPIQWIYNTSIYHCDVIQGLNLKCKLLTNTILF